LNSRIPRSLFDRYKYGKTKPISLLDYSALVGVAKCFRYLEEAGATVSVETGMFVAMGSKDETLRYYFDRKHPIERALFGGLRAYHFSIMKAVHEAKGVPLDPPSFMEFTRHKLKGIFYLHWRNEDLGAIVSEHKNVKMESSDKVTWQHILLLRAAQYNDLFMLRVLGQMEDFDFMVRTSQEFATGLHMAAAHNSVEALRFLLALPGVGVNVSDKCGTPLIVAAKMNAAEAVEALLETAAIDVNAISNDRTALMTACEFGSVAACRALAKGKGIDAAVANDQVRFSVRGFLLGLENGARFLRRVRVRGMPQDCAGFAPSLNVQVCHFACIGDCAVICYESFV
jgi:hypothetical protein